MRCWYWGMMFSFQPTSALFHLPLDCFFFCGLQVVMNLVHLSTSSCSIVPPMAIFVFSVCYIFLSDTHSQYEHTEGLLMDKCNIHVGKIMPKLIQLIHRHERHTVTESNNYCKKNPAEYTDFELAIIRVRIGTFESESQARLGTLGK